MSSLKYTGKGNEIILKNLAMLSRERSHDVIPRVPLIPGITTNPDNLQRIVAMLKEMRISRCWLLPYNPLGLSKLASIGKTTVNLPERKLSEQEMSDIKDIFYEIDLVEL